MTIFEYTYRRKKIAESPVQVRSPQDLEPLLIAHFDGHENESLVVLALDTKNNVIGLETVYIGNVAGSSVRVGECFRFAVRTNAASIIVAHNHPSADPSPSTPDLNITAEFMAAGKLLDIEVLDHLIIAGSRTTSLRALGHLTRAA